jgi:tetratricopeptide (TPR) repeat protein
VMVRPEGGNSGNIFGETPNIAARVQSLAESNTVCISAATQRLVAGFFVVEDLGPHILKGVRDSMQLYRVERATGVRSRLHAAARASFTPFVGREEERNLLMNRWTQAQKGKGQLVMITGEAGIGKSRLLQQFKEDLGGIPHTWIEGESSPYEQDTPFAPTLDLVENAFQWTAETSTETRIEELERSFSVVGIDPAKSVPLIASLFGFSVPPDQYPPILLSPEQQRVQLLQTLVDWVIGTSRLQPTVLVIEDLHFADPSTLEEFVILGEQVENAPLMLLFTARPRFQPPWPTRSFHTLIDLNRLDHDNVREMIASLLGRLIPAETMATLVERTDGNPLFAEELSQTLAESRSVASTEQQIPATLHDLLMTRLDYLGPAKEIAQMGSVLGRGFPHSLLSSISGQTEEDLQKALIRLTESGLVFGEKSPTDTIYTFKHALVQEAAYGSLLKSRRRELHRSVAKALNEKFSDLTKQRPELVAHHLTEAGDAEKAIEAWQTAAEYATTRAALVEANQHYNKALHILGSLPDTPDRAQLELPIQISLGHIVTATKGFGSTEESKAYSRAREIAEQLGESPQFFFILLGLWSTTNSRSELKASQELADEMLRIAERDSIPMYLVWAYFTQALMAYEYGNFPGVGNWVEKMMRNYNPEDHSWAPFDPKVTVLTHTGLALWHLGQIDQARKICREQYEHARTLAPANMAMAHLGACSLIIYLRDTDALLENAEAILKFAEEQQLPSFLAWGTIYRGIAHALQGDHDTGIAEIKLGLGDYLVSGTHSSLGQYLSLLAEAYARAGDIDQALATIQDAIGAAPEEQMHFPELHRVRADILLKQPNADLEIVENGYREAIDASRKYGSLTQELRAVTRLGRLLQSQGRAAEAQALLAPLYASFTEGLDTYDLREAKTLLDELSVTASS